MLVRLLNGRLPCRMPAMSERLISEAIKPVTETADTSRMAIGQPDRCTIQRLAGSKRDGYLPDPLYPDEV